jgi:hypothetical protein
MRLVHVQLPGQCQLLCHAGAPVAHSAHSGDLLRSCRHQSGACMHDHAQPNVLPAHVSMYATPRASPTCSTTGVPRRLLSVSLLHDGRGTTRTPGTPRDPDPAAFKRPTPGPSEAPLDTFCLLVLRVHEVGGGTEGVEGVGGVRQEIWSASGTLAGALACPGGRAGMPACWS